MPPDARSPWRSAAKNDHQVSRLPLCTRTWTARAGIALSTHSPSLTSSRATVATGLSLPACPLGPLARSLSLLPFSTAAATAVPLSQQWHYPDTWSLFHDDTGCGASRLAATADRMHSQTGNGARSRPILRVIHRGFFSGISPRRIRRSAFREGVPHYLFDSRGDAQLRPLSGPAQMITRARVPTCLFTNKRSTDRRTAACSFDRQRFDGTTGIHI